MTGQMTPSISFVKISRQKPIFVSPSSGEIWGLISLAAMRNFADPYCAACRKAEAGTSSDLLRFA